MKELSLLLEKLAQQLGTTAEYLWAVLVRQAVVDSYIGLAMFAIWFIGAYALYRWHLHALKPIKKNEYSEESLYEKGDGEVGVATFFIALVWVIFFLVLLFNVGDIITGFINPEYSALKEILNTIKGE